MLPLPSVAALRGSARLCWPDNHTCEATRSDISDLTTPHRRRTPSTIAKSTIAMVTQLKKEIKTHTGQIKDLHQNASSLFDIAIERFSTLLDERFVNLSDRPVKSPGPLPPPPPFLFLRLQSYTQAGEDSIPDPDLYCRTWMAGEENQIVSCAVATCFSTPFVTVLMGYSGGGKSYTVSGLHNLLAGILSPLPGTFWCGSGYRGLTSS